MSYQFLPPLSDAEYDALRADIAANGMRHPIIVDEKGKILDGHHRARVAGELGFKPERTVLSGLTETEKRDVAFTANNARRHMDTSGRRATVIASLKADPQLSDRQHGRRTGVSHPTVAGIRAELVAAGRLESLTSRIGADGRERPATRPSSPTDRDPDLTSGPAVATAGPSGQDHPSATGEADARLAADRKAASEAPTGVGAPVEAGADEPVGETGPTTAGGGSSPSPAVDPIDDPEHIARQHREGSSAAVAEALVSIKMRLEPDPIRWLNETWLPGGYRFRDMPRVRDCFTPDGLRTSAKYLEMLADHLDATGDML